MNSKSVRSTNRLAQIQPAPEPLPGVACNICGGTKFKLGPLGRSSITDLPPVCVQCGSLERHRVFRALFNQFRSPDFKALSCLMFSMDRSVAAGWFGSFRYSVYGTDNSLDLQDIALPNEAFDVVICNHVLEHVPRYEMALKEIVRVLSRRGFAFISFPNPHYRKETSDWGFPKEHGHYRVFGSDIEAKLPAILPGVGILRVVAKDPVTETEERAYIVSKSDEVLDRVTDKGVRCRFLRAQS
jgi:SAM-dependent methyltransferase